MVGDQLVGALQLVMEALSTLGTPHALIGGAAMPAWFHERSTRDLDLLLLLTPH